MNIKKGREDARERFKRLAISRTKEVLKRLRILGHCANKQAYEYTADDIDKMFSAIEKQVKVVRAKFSNNIDTQDIDFKL